MVDRFNDMVSFVDKPITIFTAVVWHWSVPQEEKAPFEVLKFYAGVAKFVIGKSCF